MTKKKKKQHNKVNRLVFNGIYSSLSWIVPLILAFFSTPIILKGLGEENYGIYALILGFIGYSFNFGIGRAVVKFVSEYRSQGKIKEAEEIVSSTFYLCLFFGITANLFIILFANFIVRDLLQISAERQSVAVNALYISGATVIVLLIGQVYLSLVQAVHRFDTVAVVQNITGILMAIGNIALVLSGYGILPLIFWNLFVSSVSLTLFYTASRKFLPELKTTLRFSSNSIAMLGKFGLGIFAYQVSGNLILLFERGWVIRRFGEETLTYYVVPMALGIYILSFILSVVQVTFPVISEMQNEPEKIIKLYQKSTKIVLTIIAFITISMICGGKLLLSLWITPQFAENSYIILAFHSLTFGTIAIYSISWQLAEGFGKPKINAFISFVWLAISIPAMILFSYKWGENGVAFARFLAVILTFPAIFYTEKRFLGSMQGSFWVTKVLKLSSAILVAYFVETWIFGVLDVKWISLILGGFGGLAAFLGCLLILGFITEDEKILIRGFLKR